MSKEKLQEIKKDNTHHSFYLLPREVDELMKLAYNQALDDAMDEARIKVEDNTGFSYTTGSDKFNNVTVEVDKQSILKLKI